GCKTSFQMSQGESFRRFIASHWIVVLIVLLLALVARLILIIRFPMVAPDEFRYTIPATNMLAGRGFSSFANAPYLPTIHTMPLYPLFIAAVYRLFGNNNLTVRAIQAVTDLGACILVAFVSFNLARPSWRRIAALSSMAIYGFMSWFTIFWI